eukprot:scaffold4302_cov94-Skeletonema_dohrnii-CCMP3373.AAC.1
MITTTAGGGWMVRLGNHSSQVSSIPSNLEQHGGDSYFNIGAYSELMKIHAFDADDLVPHTSIFINKITGIYVDSIPRLL